MIKKGFVYSFIVLLFILLFVTSVLFLNSFSFKEKTYTYSMVINTLDTKFTYAQKDISRGIYIVGLRTLIAMNDIIVSSGEFINDFDNVFYEIFFNGTYEGNELSIMNDTSFKDFKQNFKSALKKDKLIINITPLNLFVEMSSPWHVKVSVNMTLLFSDDLQTAFWKNDYLISSEISIVELDDPLYLVYSHGFVPNQIRITNVTEFVTGNDVSNLLYHMNNSLYIPSNRAPNFLMRMQGIISPNQYGIESLINYDKFALQGLPYKQRSAVDHIYFLNFEIINQSNILGMPDWFLLDEDYNSIQIYGCENLIIS